MSILHPKSSSLQGRDPESLQLPWEPQQMPTEMRSDIVIFDRIRDTWWSRSINHLQITMALLFETGKMPFEKNECHQIFFCWPPSYISDAYTCDFGVNGISHHVSTMVLLLGMEQSMWAQSWGNLWASMAQNSFLWIYFTFFFRSIYDITHIYACLFIYRIYASSIIEECLFMCWRVLVFRLVNLDPTCSTIVPSCMIVCLFVWLYYYGSKGWFLAILPQPLKCVEDVH